MRALVAVAVIAMSSGCATGDMRRVGTAPTVVWEDKAGEAPVAPPAAMTVDEARSIALAHDAAHTCEITAKSLRAKDKQRGWAVMEQCIRRPDFSDLESLVMSPWNEDIAKHPDYATLIAHVIAVRGGDVAYDLRLCRKAKLPVFSLKAAVAEPDQYKGRVVIMRGSAVSGRTVDGARALQIAETKVMAESEWVTTGPRVQSEANTDTRDHSSGSPRQGFAERHRRQDSSRVEVLHNVSVETGLEVLAAVPGDAPFLEAGTDYILVLRFDGTREVIAGSEMDDKPAATVIGYFEPESGLFARLGR